MTTTKIIAANYNKMDKNDSNVIESREIPVSNDLTTRRHETFSL